MDAVDCLATMHGRIDESIDDGPAAPDLLDLARVIPAPTPDLSPCPC